MVEWKEIFIPSLYKSKPFWDFNHTIVTLLGTTHPFISFEPSLAYEIGYNGNGISVDFSKEYIYTFVTQKRVENTSPPFRREYHSFRFPEGFKRTDIFTKRPEDIMYGKVPKTSQGNNLLIGVCGPFPYLNQTFYSVFNLTEKRIEYCLENASNSDASLSLDREVSPYDYNVFSFDILMNSRFCLQFSVGVNGKL